jgi:hypothetical protein
VARGSKPNGRDAVGGSVYESRFREANAPMRRISTSIEISVAERRFPRSRTGQLAKYAPMARLKILSLSRIAERRAWACRPLKVLTDEAFRIAKLTLNHEVDHLAGVRPSINVVADENKPPLIRGAVPFKSAPWKMVEPEGVQLSA